MRLLFCIFLIPIFFAGCQKTAAPGDSVFMVDLLEKVADKHSSYKNPYMHHTRVDFYDSLMRDPTASAEKKLGYHYHKSMELLNAGRSAEAAVSFIGLREAMLHYKDEFPEQINARLPQIESLIAICYLRQGEQENCILNHSSASCIIPIVPAGFHQLEEGSSKAIAAYTEILQKNDTALDARWLLNIAYMTLGEYPDGVPPQWLIPPDGFASEYPLQKFEDIAPDLGLDSRALSGGTIIEDFNGDGLLDVMVTSWGLRDQMQYFQNNGDGSFSERTEEAGLIGLVCGLNMLHTDYNNDGHADVLVLRGAWLNEHGRHPNSLLRNNGPNAEGIPTFTDVTREVGLLELMPAQTAVWNDFNNDGWVDLFIGNETPLGKFYKFPTTLYINNLGTFTEVAEEAGIEVTEYVKGVTSGDYDNDGWADIYISTLEGQNFLFKNQGANQKGIPQFKDVTEAAGLLENIKTFPTWFWDYNNDGWLDIFVAGYNRGTAGHISHQVAAEYLDMPYQGDMPRLYQNNKDGSFSDVTRKANLHRVIHAMGSNFGDLDNDGFLDMVLGTGDPDFRSIVPNLAFRNAGGAYFQDVTTAGGFGNLQKGHAVAFADLDHDGDQDVFINMGGANYGDVYQNALFQNPHNDDGEGNGWISLLLEGTRSNRMAIGARIKAVITENGQQRSIFKEVNSGGSFGANPFRQTLGLGGSIAIDTLEVYWPVTGKTQKFTDIAANQFLKIREGEDTPVVLSLPKLNFKEKASPAHAKHAHE